MKFTNQYPKNEITIETTSKVGSLLHDNNSVVHYRHYQGYLDKIDHITLSGSKNAWYGIKTDFMYDKTINKLKPFYIDEFGRKMIVKILS
jgi:hypothetical protein